MKKLFLVLAILIPTFAFAQDEFEIPFEQSEYTRNYFIGVKAIGHSYMTFESSKVQNGETTSLKNQDSNFGLGFNVGRNFGKYIKSDLEFEHSKSVFMTYAETDTYHVYSGMANLYLTTPTKHGDMKPYIGFGLGASNISLKTEMSDIDGTDNSVKFAYQFMGGFDFILNDRWNLDIGLKYKNFGSIENTVLEKYYAGFGYDVQYTTDIYATEFYAGFTYKFGI